MDSHAGGAQTRDSYTTPRVLGLHYDDYYCRARRGCAEAAGNLCACMWGGDKGAAQILSLSLVENGVAKGLGSAGFCRRKNTSLANRGGGGWVAEIAIYLGRAIR